MTGLECRLGRLEAASGINATHPAIFVSFGADDPIRSIVSATTALTSRTVANSIISKIGADLLQGGNVRLRLSLILAILCFTSQLALAADVQSTVGDFFSDSISSRFRAQRDFYDHFRTDPAAINALVDKALGNITSVPGEYDTLSILDRLPASSVTQSELRDKIVLLANHASGNSLDTARKAANVLVKFRAAATPPSDSSSVPNSVESTVDKFFSDKRSDRVQAQEDFYDKLRTDSVAIDALVEKALANVQFVPGVHDVLSILDRIPPDAVKLQALREKVVRLAGQESGNSPDTAQLAARVRAKFGAQAEAPPNPNLANARNETSRYGPVWQRAR